MVVPGDVIADRYVVGEQLGSGGMGTVYLAHDRKLDRSVALKVIHAESVPGSSGQQRMLREARAAARLSHPGIVEVYDVGTTQDGGAFLVMELVQGRTGRTLIADGIERGELLSAVTDIADALHAAHSAGVVHRDVKPDNIMVRDDGRVVLLDFGLVKRVPSPLTEAETPDTPSIAQLTASGSIVGTPAYLAPEQARGRALPATDQWALAVTAYELLCGSLPWIGTDVAHVLAQILMDEPIPLSTRCEVPEAADSVFTKALQKDPGARYEDVRAFAADLRRALEGEEPHLPEGGAVRERPARSAPGSVAAAPSNPRVPARRTGCAVGAIGASIAAVALILANPGAEAPEDGDGSPAMGASLGEEAVVACPVLEVRGLEEPRAWFGAATASSLCVRLTTLLGGDPNRTRPPSVLLGLPALPTAEFPDEPYDRGSREATLEAARAADAWLDGTVSRHDDGSVSLQIELVTPAGVVGEASADGENIHVASSAVLRGLSEAGLPVVERVSDLVAAEVGASDPFEVIRVLDLELATLSGVSDSDACRSLLSDASLGAASRARVETRCLAVVPGSLPSESPLDESTPLSFLFSVVPHARHHPGSDVRPWIDRLQSDRGRLAPEARALSLAAEGNLHVLAGDSEAARPLLRNALEQRPREFGVRVALCRCATREALGGLYSIVPAWNPELGDAWMAQAMTAEDSSRGVALSARALLLSPYAPQVAETHARRLGGLRRVEEIRTLASRFLVLRDPPIVGASLLAQSLALEGRFGRAFETLIDAYMSYEGLGRLVQGDYHGWFSMLELAQLLERQEDVDGLLEHFVLDETHRLFIHDQQYEGMVLTAALIATPEIGLEAIGRLLEIRESTRTQGGVLPGIDPLLRGVTAHLRGDDAAAAVAWRPLITTAGSRSWMGGCAPIFDAVGALELARTIDASHLGATRLAGISYAHPREAERSAALGEAERARQLAQQVIDAWSTADVNVPAVARMRALLERLPTDEG